MGNCEERGEMKMELKRAIGLQDSLNPVGPGAKLWRFARDVTWEVVKKFITPAEGEGGMLKFPVRSTAWDLGISVDELERLLVFSERGDYPRDLLAVRSRSRGVFWIADLDAEEEQVEKAVGNSQGDSLASLRQPISD